MKTVLLIVGVVAAAIVGVSLQHIPAGKVGALETGGEVRLIDPGLRLKSRGRCSRS
jgi:hypothetical protein